VTGPHNGQGADWRLVLPSCICDLRLWPEQATEVHFDPESQIEPRELAKMIDISWTRMCAQSRTMGWAEPHDARKFHLYEASTTPNGPTLRLGITSYKQYMAFRNSREVRVTAEAAAGVLGLEQTALYPKALGVVALVLTIDSRVPIILRSSAVATYRGYLDLPGGHPEPDQVSSISNGPSLAHTAVRDELFGAVLREVEEDLGVPCVLLGQPLLLAAVESIEDFWKPDLVFVLQSPLAEQEIREAVTGAGEEVERIHFVDPFAKAFDLGSSVTPVLKAAFELWRNYAMGAQDALS